MNLLSLGKHYKIRNEAKAFKLHQSLHFRHALRIYT